MEEDVPPADRIPTPLYSPRPPPEAHHHHPHHRHHLPDPRLRHTRSHEPTPTFFDDGAEPDGYFPPPSSYPHPHLPNRRSFSPTSDAPYQSPPPPDASSPPPPPIPGFGPSLGPSASPLFASHIARQPQPPPPMGTGSPPMGPEPQYRDFAHPPPPHPDGRRRSRPPPGYDSPPPEPGRNGRHRRRGEDPRMPMRGPPPHHRDRRSLDPRDRRMYDDRPPLDDRPPFGRPPYDDRPPYADRPPFDDRPPYDERPPYDDSPPPPRRRSRRRSDAGRRRPISPGDPRSRSGSEFGPPEGARDGRRGSVGKMTRFAEKGVGGRRYA